MNRRRFLGAIGTATVTATSGCMGYTVKKESEIKKKNEEISKQQEKINSLDSDVSKLEEKVSQLNETNSELEGSLEQKKDELKETKAKHILYLYGNGVSEYNNGSEKYDSATTYYDANNYVAARAELNVAAGYFDSAKATFGVASSRAAEFDYSQISDWATDAQDKCLYLAEASSHYQELMYHILNDNQQRADNAREKGDADYSSSENYEVRDRSTLEEQLNTSI